MRYCCYNGCSNKVTEGLYCKEHRLKKKKRKRKSIYHHENKSFYNSDEWKSMRSFIYERDKGCCRRCGKFVFGKHAHVHHIVPIKKNPLLKLDPNNLMLLCPQCHTIVENEEEQKTVFPSYFNSPPTQN
jgi:5-methylcytosine-specific restriction enzyme A